MAYRLMTWMFRGRDRKELIRTSFEGSLRAFDDLRHRPPWQSKAQGCYGLNDPVVTCTRSICFPGIHNEAARSVAKPALISETSDCVFCSGAAFKDPDELDIDNQIVTGTISPLMADCVDQSNASNL